MSYLKHQIVKILRGMGICTIHVSSFDLLHVGLLALLAASWYFWRHGVFRGQWQWGGIGILAICLPYLPVVHDPLRIYYGQLFRFCWPSAWGPASASGKPRGGGALPRGCWPRPWWPRLPCLPFTRQPAGVCAPMAGDPPG